MRPSHGCDDFRNIVAHTEFPPQLAPSTEPYAAGPARQLVGRAAANVAAGHVMIFGSPSRKGTGESYL